MFYSVSAGGLLLNVLLFLFGRSVHLIMPCGAPIYIYIYIGLYSIEYRGIGQEPIPSSRVCGSRRSIMQVDSALFVALRGWHLFLFGRTVPGVVGSGKNFFIFFF